MTHPCEVPNISQVSARSEDEVRAMTDQQASRAKEMGCSA
jgi:hypothetical protein